MPDRAPGRRDDHAESDEQMRRQLEAAAHFPDQNPNPVLPVDAASTLAKEGVVFA